MKPLIGITTSLVLHGRIDPSRSFQFLDWNYVRAVEQAGGVPLILPIVEDAVNTEDLAARLDGLLISGGGDLSSNIPDEPVLSTLNLTPEPRVTFESRLMDYACRERLPILGVCYGMQLINRYFDGTLYQDIGMQLEGKLEHKPSESSDHPARVVRGTTLHGLVGKDSIIVNTSHHQAVRDLGEGLRVCATSEDGVIEAIEHVDFFILGVQWHPEKWLELEDTQRIYRGLIDACLDGKEGGRAC